MRSIYLYTDFGHRGPYVGQMHGIIHQLAPGTPIVDLMHDAPRFDPRAGAYLLAALVPWLPLEACVCAVVDPGVGSDRRALALRADQRWVVGPDNGLLEVVARRADRTEWYTLQPDGSESATFHGRDLFAPLTAMLATGQEPGVRVRPGSSAGHDLPDQLGEVIYIDEFGNAMTGLIADGVDGSRQLKVGDRELSCQRTFSDAAAGEAFWYANSVGLVEIAVNQGSAAEALSLAVGSPVDLD